MKKVLQVLVSSCSMQVNTQAPSNVTDCSDRNYSKYYVVVVQVLSVFSSTNDWIYPAAISVLGTFYLQYTARFNAETVKNFLYALNDGRISKKKFNCKLLRPQSHHINNPSSPPGYVLALLLVDSSPGLHGLYSFFNHFWSFKTSKG